MLLAPGAVPSVLPPPPTPATRRFVRRGGMIMQQQQIVAQLQWLQLKVDEKLKEDEVASRRMAAAMEDAGRKAAIEAAGRAEAEEAVEAARLASAARLAALADSLAEAKAAVDEARAARQRPRTAPLTLRERVRSDLLDAGRKGQARSARSKCAAMAAQTLPCPTKLETLCTFPAGAAGGECVASPLEVTRSTKTASAVEQRLLEQHAALVHQRTHVLHQVNHRFRWHTTCRAMYAKHLEVT